MTDSQNVNLSKNNNIDLSKIKSGIKASDLGLQGEALNLFNSSDFNKNGKLDGISEVSLFQQKAANFNNNSQKTQNSRQRTSFSFDFEQNFALKNASEKYLASGISKSEKIVFERMSQNDKLSFLRSNGFYNEERLSNVCASDNTRIETQNVKFARAEVKRTEAQAHEKKVVAVEKEMAAKYTPEQKKNMKRVVSNMQSNYQEAKASFDYQMKKDGWAADTADAIAHLWNNSAVRTSGNTADMVRSDLDVYQKQMKSLNEGIKDGSFERKFLNTYGVQYNPTNIKQYNKAKSDYEQIFAKAHAHEAFTSSLKSSLDNIANLEKQLAQEEAARKAGRGSGLDYTTSKLNAAKMVFVNKMQEVMGIEKDNNYNPNRSLDKEYNQYLQLYKEVDGVLLKEKNENVQKLEEASKRMSAARAKAYGTRNDIVARVENYNSSQDAGAACVKFVAGVALNALGPSSIAASFVYGAATSVAMDVADSATNGIEGDFDLKSTAVNAAMNGVFASVNQSIVNKYSGNVASKILNSAAGQSTSRAVGSKLTGFVVKEIISKEGVKLPAYGVEGVTKPVIRYMSGIKTSEDGKGLSQKELENAMSVVSEAMIYLATARDNGKLDKNITQQQMVSLLNEHISASTKDNKNFTEWLNSNQAQFQQMLNQLVQNELPKTNGQLKLQ